MSLYLVIRSSHMLTDGFVKDWDIKKVYSQLKLTLQTSSYFQKPLRLSDVFFLMTHKVTGNRSDITLSPRK